MLSYLIYQKLYSFLQLLASIFGITSCYLPYGTFCQHLFISAKCLLLLCAHLQLPGCILCPSFLKRDIKRAKCLLFHWFFMFLSAMLSSIVVLEKGIYQTTGLLYLFHLYVLILHSTILASVLFLSSCKAEHNNFICFMIRTSFTPDIISVICGR